MRIAFNGVGCGFGNNGGTQSVFRMAAALASEGAQVEVWSHYPNVFTWFDLEVPFRLTSLEDAPEVDVLINTGSPTTRSTYEFRRKKVGVQWLRAHETWRVQEHVLFDLYSLDMPLWANSEWMVNLVSDAGIRDDCEVQYCGVPHQLFYPVETIRSDSLVVGGLWSLKPRKCSGRILNIASHPELSDVKWKLLGAEPKPHLPKNVKYCRQPSTKAKRAMYSSCDIWFAPSESEGLHIPPMEAALCGAAVVARDIPAAGNMDYCHHGLTGILYSGIPEAVSAINSLRDNGARSGMSFAMREVIRAKIGDVTTNAKRMLARLEKHLR